MRCEREVCGVQDQSEMQEVETQGDGTPSREREVRDAGEEGVEPVVRRTESKPSAKEVEEHRATHYPFCEWCRYCVGSVGRRDVHK